VRQNRRIGKHGVPRESDHACVDEMAISQSQRAV
jgi:hypothetical protein